MERAASAGLRACLRTSSSKTLRCRVPNASAAKCVATAVCPARSMGGTSITTKTQSTSPIPVPVPRRDYSTAESSIGGTIGKGEAGRASEAPRTKEMLQAPDHLNEKERQIWDLLNKELQAEKLEVRDISGGCGSMYGIEIVSERFRGLSVLQQQRMVNGVLGEEIKGWHGVQLRTSAP